ncbi:hypothetical protein J6590_059791 [Homalodisca vitripennis]|nr:hypothetical protein J6590_059791 [Homalodisca vitripennis]
MLVWLFKRICGRYGQVRALWCNGSTFTRPGGASIFCDSMRSPKKEFECQQRYFGGDLNGGSRVRMKQRRACVLLGWLAAERRSPCKHLTCPAISGGAEIKRQTHNSVSHINTDYETKCHHFPSKSRLDTSYIFASDGEVPQRVGRRLRVTFDKGRSGLIESGRTYKSSGDVIVRLVIEFAIISQFRRTDSYQILLIHRTTGIHSPAGSLPRHQIASAGAIGCTDNGMAAADRGVLTD